MSIIQAYHQFEIRFTPILNFHILSRNIIAPYLSRTSSISIDSENLVKQRISLIFDDDSYTITLLWDRILFHTSSGITNLASPNSVVEEPFFSIFKKITELSEFGSILNCLFYTITANLKADYKVDDFIKDFLREDLSNILPCTDVKVTLNEVINNDTIALDFGPYIGIEDLNNRNIKYDPEYKDSLTAEGGILVDLKIVQALNAMNFKIYQRLTEKSNSILNKIWERI